MDLGECRSVMDDYQTLRLKLHTFHKVCWKWNINCSSWPAVKTKFFFRSIKYISSNWMRHLQNFLLRIHLPPNLINVTIYLTFDDVWLIKRKQLFSCITGEEEICVIRGNRLINRTLNAYSFSVETTSLKRILDVRVWPWYTMGSPSPPSQQSTSTQRQPLFKALHAKAASKIDQSWQSQFVSNLNIQICIYKFACLPQTKLVTQKRCGYKIISRVSLIYLAWFFGSSICQVSLLWSICFSKTTS